MNDTGLLSALLFGGGFVGFIWFMAWTFGRLDRRAANIAEQQIKRAGES